MTGPRAIEVLRVDDGLGPALELLRCAPQVRCSAPPLLLVHGAYTDAWCWAETYLPYFAQRGYETWAPTLRGRGASEGVAALDAWGLADYLKDVARCVDRIARPCVLIGSSMGGLLVQRWLSARREARAAVTIGSVPPQGLGAAMLRLAFGTPRAFGRMLQLATSGVSSRETLGLFAEHPLRPREPDFWRRHVFRESSRALWDLTWLPMVMPTPAYCPVLACHGAADRLVPVASVAAVARHFGAQTMIFDAVGHAPMLERQWTGPAERIADWLDLHAREENAR